MERADARSPSSSSSKQKTTTKTTTTKKKKKKKSALTDFPSPSSSSSPHLDPSRHNTDESPLTLSPTSPSGPGYGSSGHAKSSADVSSSSKSKGLDVDDADDDPLMDAESQRQRQRPRPARRRTPRRSKAGIGELEDSMIVTNLAFPGTGRAADATVMRRSVINVGLIGLWYLFSLSISLYNKWMFGKEHLDFSFPLFTTSTHMLVQFTLASLVLIFFPRFRPVPDADTRPATAPPPPFRDMFSIVTRSFYLTRLGPCGAATGMDIGLGNTSLKYITLVFFTMCKSSALAFVLLFAFVFRLEAPSWRLILIIACMTGGVVMMVFGEVNFNLLGFILIILSSFFSGFRWALTQILLIRHPATGNPFASIFFLTPIMWVSLLILAIPIETFPALIQGMITLIEKKGIVLGPLLLLFPGVLAFCMTSAEYALLQRTSVVTLSICGIFKEVVTISAAELVFHDPLTPINLSGLVVTICSIAAYNYLKIQKMRRDARDGLQSGGGMGAEGPGLLDEEAEEGLLADSVELDEDQIDDLGRRRSG